MTIESYLESHYGIIVPEGVRWPPQVLQEFDDFMDESLSERKQSVARDVWLAWVRPFHMLAALGLKAGQWTVALEEGELIGCHWTNWEDHFKSTENKRVQGIETMLDIERRILDHLIEGVTKHTALYAAYCKSFQGGESPISERQFNRHLARLMPLRAARLP